MDFKDVFETYLKKTRPYKNIHHIQWSTTRYLMRDHSYPHFDFIYIDADHTTVGVIMDAELAWPNLKSGGIMAFDDYEWGSNLPMHLRAKPGIDLFMLRHDGEYELLTKNQQVWIRKN
jgi:predicted O-methyltransferase YrrM